METFLTNSYDNNRSTERQLVLSPIEGQKAKDARGKADSRLWTGENEVYAILDPATLLWRLKYKIGDIPQSMKQSWTSFPRLMKVVEPYFESRGLKITEVRD